MSLKNALISLKNFYTLVFNTPIEDTYATIEISGNLKNAVSTQGDLHNVQTGYKNGVNFTLSNDKYTNLGYKWHVTRSQLSD